MIRRRLDARSDAGFTLVELMVAMVISAILGTVLVSMLVATRNSSHDTTVQQDLTSEARDALNRMAEDLREATPLTVTDPTTGAVTTIPAIQAIQATGPVIWLTFNADFNGDGCVAGVASDTPPGATTTCTTSTPASAGPETESFCWNSSSGLLYLIGGAVHSASDCTGDTLVSGKVTNLSLSYSSTHYLYDANHDGVTTWQELDAYGAPVGNQDGAPDGPELQYLNNVGIELTVSDNHGHSQTFRTQVNLRNVP